MPTENGLPQYVSKDAKSGNYQYYRRPPTGVKGPAFVRSFSSKDRRVVHAKYARIHTEAEAYFARLISGRSLSDMDLKMAAMGLVLQDDPDRRGFTGKLPTGAEFRARMIELDPRAKDIPEPDMARLVQFAMKAFLGEEITRTAQATEALDRHREAIREVTPLPVPKDQLTLRLAYETAWKPAAIRSKNTVTEVGRYVDEFTKLNGVLPLAEYTREHWAKWRADCLAIHGPGATAFKRFSMMKTICNEAIRGGLFERKNFAGQDVSMRKIKGKKLRNEGWLQDELKTLFEAPVYRGVKEGKHSDADYWVPVIGALTGARLSEIVGMDVPDVAERHGVWTFHLAAEGGKTEDSRRIIPIPKRIIDLGFLTYLETRPKKGPLFENATPKKMSQWFARLRADLGLDRKGCDFHAFRHHMKTLLGDLECPDRVSDYITGHAPPNVSRTYGKTDFVTALKYLNGIDLGIRIPKWPPKVRS